MKFRLLAALIPVLALVQTASGQQSGTTIPAVRSPEVLSDRRVTFRLAAPKAADVRVTCECFDGAQALQKDDKGVWSATLGPFESDIYEYEFTVDGVTILDPRNEKVKYNGRPSTISSLLDVSGSAPRFYDARPVPHGKVEIRWYPSKAVNGTRRVYVYTPPGYERGTTRLPVLYLLHGADGDDSAWTAFGRANHILDNLMADRKVTPMVVVMPFGYAYPPASGAAADKQRTDFEKDLLEDIVPFVQSNYRVFADRDHRAIAGLSMGGGQSLNIGLRHLDLFSRVASFSGAVPRGAGAADSFKDVLADAKKLNTALKLFWIGCGTEDGLYAPNKEFSALLNKSGVTHTFHSSGGAHTWIVWRKYLQEVAPQLFPTTPARSTAG
jgi:enterochelin esterase family protein